MIIIKENDNIDKVLLKRELKKNNGMDTLDEDVQILNSFFDQVLIDDTDDENKKKTGKILKHPLVECRELYSEYIPAFTAMENVFQKLKAKKTEENFDLFIEQFRKYDDILIELSAALIDFGNFIPAYDYKDLPAEIVLSHDRFFSISVLDYVEEILPVIKKINKYIKEALDEADKSKCMTLSPYLTGYGYNVEHLIEIKKASD